MSSANLVSVVYTPEAVYGIKDDPLSGVTLETTRFTSESLSGTPTTTQSAAIRTDRMSGGQVVTGLEVGGALDFELSTGQFFDDFFEAGLMTTWVPVNATSSDVVLTPFPADDQRANLVTLVDLTAAGVVVGDVLQLVPTTGDPVTVQVITVVGPLDHVVATKRGELPIFNVVMSVEVPEYGEIGTDQRSFSVGKSYLDVQHLATTDNHSQTYTGSLVSSFNISASYGEIVTGNFGTQANGYEQEAPSFEQQVVAAGGTVNPAGTSNPLNASIDVPLVTSDGVASTWCMESFTIDLDNGLSPENCIGKIAPLGYTLGTAEIAITASIYNSDTAYDDFMASKMTQDPVSMTFTMQNSSGGWAFSMPAVQLSFPDPAATGANEQTLLDASGTAKVGANGESAIRIYKLVGEQ